MPNEDNNLNPTSQNQNWQNQWWNNQWQNSDNKILWNYNFDFWFDTPDNQTTNNQWTWNNWNVWNYQQPNNQNNNTQTNQNNNWVQFTWNENIQSNENTATKTTNINMWDTTDSRSWKFLTPDEETKKTESTASGWWTANGAQRPENPTKTPEEIRAEEDAFFENIDLWDSNDTTNNGIDTNTINQYEQNSPTATNNNINEENQATKDTINYNINIENNNGNNNIQNTNNDDWLAQEDKKVEETFGANKKVPETQNINTFNNIESNWENSANINNNTWDNYTNNTWTNDSIETWTNISNTWWTANTNQWYTPNENDFSQMTWILNSAWTWPINLNDNNQWESNNAFWDININDIISDPVIQNNVESIEITEKDENNNVETEEINLDNVQNASIYENNNIQPTQDININMQNNTTNQNNNTPFWDINFDNTQNVPNESNNVQSTQEINVNDNPNPTTNEAPMEISLDSILINNPENNNQENTVVQDGKAPIQNENTSQQEQKSTQVPQKKKKKSWWLRVLIVIVIALGACAIRFVQKMAPDLLNRFTKSNSNNLLDTNINKIVNEFWRGDNVEDNVWDTLFTDDENELLLVDENNEVDNNTGTEDNEITENENTNDTNDTKDIEAEESETSTNNENELLDPNSLAALLEQEEENDTWTNTEIEAWPNEHPMDDQEITVWDDEFNAFSELDNILTNNDEIDKLNWYIAQWEYFQQRWIDNNNMVVKIYWEEQIIKPAQEALTELENWWEIDTSVYDNLDDTISKLTNLVNQQSNG